MASKNSFRFFSRVLAAAARRKSDTLLGVALKSWSLIFLCMLKNAGKRGRV
jgi:hypothetical protein